jgi:uncharacterized membrane protein YphA (DoxX/SURF4 family)
LYLSQGALVRSRQVILDVVLWIFAIFLAWIFIRQGWSKFDDTSGWAKAFRLWHYPTWFRVTVGIAETAAALLLLTRRTAFAGALIIIVVMLGGMSTHVYWGHPEQMTSEALPLVLATIVAIGRRKSFFFFKQPA